VPCLVYKSKWVLYGQFRKSKKKKQKSGIH
jgi:hypothetical protein